MDSNLAKFWGAMALMFLVGVGVKILRADIDWTSETPAAYLQFAAGAAALGATTYFAVHARRAANAAEARADRIESAALKEKNDTRAEVIAAALWIVDNATKELVTAIRMAEREDAKAKASTMSAVKHAFATYTRAMDILQTRAVEGFVLVALVEVRQVLAAPEIAPHGLEPQSVHSVLVGLAGHMLRARKKLEEAQAMARAIYG